jgi:hypothetical protein
MKLLDLVRRQKVAVRVAGDVLVVTMPGTTFSITYEKTEENRLIASSFQARKGMDETRKVFFPKIPRLGVDSRKREGKRAWLDQVRRPGRCAAATRKKPLTACTVL